MQITMDREIKDKIETLEKIRCLKDKIRNQNRRIDYLNKTIETQEHIISWLTQKLEQAELENKIRQEKIEALIKEYEESKACQ